RHRRRRGHRHHLLLVHAGASCRVRDRPPGLHPIATGDRRRARARHRSAAERPASAQSGEDRGGASRRARALMRLWKVALLLTLGLIATGAWGWARRGRHVQRLQTEVAEARASAGGEREWRVAGVVRAILPEVGVVILTHEEITGFMPPMTMG